MHRRGHSPWSWTDPWGGQRESQTEGPDFIFLQVGDGKGPKEFSYKLSKAQSTVPRAGWPEALLFKGLGQRWFVKAQNEHTGCPGSPSVTVNLLNSALSSRNSLFSQRNVNTIFTDILGELREGQDSLVFHPTSFLWAFLSLLLAKMRELGCFRGGVCVPGVLLSFPHKDTPWASQQGHHWAQGQKPQPAWE